MFDEEEEVEADRPDEDVAQEVEQQHSHPEVDEQARTAVLELFAQNPERVFYQRQITVLLEKPFFHWITIRVLKELEEAGQIKSELMTLTEKVSIRIYRSNGHRYWKRQAAELVKLVGEFSTQNFMRGVGLQGEVMFDAALPRIGFVPAGTKVRNWKGRTWTATGHDLDRVFVADGVAYGVEVKNKLEYIDRFELRTKIAMCEHLGLVPLFIMRSAAKTYIHEINLAGGYALIFDYQLYPYAHRDLAQRVKSVLGLPVDCPASIADGTLQRLLKFHKKRLGM